MSCSASPIQLRALSVVIDSPNTSTSPDVIRIRLQMALMAVVLPAPLGPSRPKKAPSWTSRFRFSTARVPSS